MIAVKSTVPITLKVKWINATRLEFAFAPIAASNAVTQVPIFAPKTINNAKSKSSTPVPTIVMTTPVEAEELWMSAVKITPIKIKSKGKSTLSKI